MARETLPTYTGRCRLSHWWVQTGGFGLPRTCEITKQLAGAHARRRKRTHIHKLACKMLSAVPYCDVKFDKSKLFKKMQSKESIKCLEAFKWTTLFFSPPWVHCPFTFSLFISYNREPYCGLTIPVIIQLTESKKSQETQWRRNILQFRI